MHVSEYGVEEDETGKTHRCATEEQVYEVLGLPYIEPELREGRGELQAAIAGELPELVTEADLKGDLHCPHDALGRAQHARRTWRRPRRSAATSTSRSPTTPPRTASATTCRPTSCCGRSSGCASSTSSSTASRVLAGSEVNINTDGSLDYADEVLEELDWVVASVHTSFRMGEEKMTKRMMAAMDHPLVDVIGHPTGRKILRREPYAVDIERIVEHAAETGTMLEINANPDRRDLNDLNARLAARGGRADRDQLRRAQHAHAGRDPLRRRDRAPRLAHEGAGREHAHLAAAEQAAQARPPQGGYGAAPLTDVSRRRPGVRTSSIAPNGDVGTT